MNFFTKPSPPNMSEKRLQRCKRRHSIVCAHCSDSIEGQCDSHINELQPNMYRGRSIAVFTSGGDSQGMNSAVRAVVRFGRFLGCKVYFIKEGYQGMVDGGKNIVEAEWSSVSGIINKGGTVIGSARCMDFKEKEGRLKAAKNLIDHGITNLVVIGGDGSLTGANCFREEWPDLLQELKKRNLITDDQVCSNAHLNIVGMVGSIDNDFCGTDMTIGTDSALHRIIEAVDDIIPTASSHQRTFIMEVMGRHCGYLALVAAIASEADFVFIPEFPPIVDWPEKLCKKLRGAREAGQRLNIIIVSEGAIDRAGQPITCEQVKNVVIDNLNQDTRITILGHVQRGGAPSAFDRILGCRMGGEAVLALMDATPETEAVVVSLEGNTAVRVPLMECVKKTQDVAAAMLEKNWDLAVHLRGRSFKKNLETYLKLTLNRPKPSDIPSTKVPLNFAVIHVGAPCCGINAAVRSFVRNCILAGHKPVGFTNGFEGLFTNSFVKLTWESVNGWALIGGAKMGTKRTLPTGKFDEVAKQLREHQISGLFIIGGFEAFHATLMMAEQREKYPEFQIPIVVLPATISNNVPGTDFCLGADTALNEISEICDRVRQSAAGTKRRIFILEVMGGYCGYLATMSGIAGGADNAYIHEEKFTVRDIMRDLDMLKSKMELGKIQRGLIMRNEKANSEYTTEFLYSLFAEEGRNFFSVRKNVLGHMQQGGTPSPFDRNLGTKMASKATNWMVEIAEGHLTPEGKVVTNGPDSAVLLGLRQAANPFTPVQDLVEEADFVYRRPKRQWWMQMRSMMRILARHDTTYSMDVNTLTAVEENGDA